MIFLLMYLWTAKKVKSDINIKSITYWLLTQASRRYRCTRNPVLAAGIKSFSVGELRWLWGVERQRARSQSILKQVAYRNHRLDKRAMRGQRVCVWVTGPISGGAYVQVSWALTDIHRAQWESLTLACWRTHSQQVERADRETVRDAERVCERKSEARQRVFCIKTARFFHKWPVSRATGLNPRSYPMHYWRPITGNTTS